MAWTSSTGVVGVGINGVTSTTSNHALIVGGDLSNDYLEVYGVSDTVLGGGGSDSIGAMFYPAQGMYGTYDYLNGNGGNDILIAAPIQGEQYAMLIGGTGTDTFGVGCNSDSTINAVIGDINIRTEPVGIFYEGYDSGKFTCYLSDNGLVISDDEGRLNVMLRGVYDVNYVLNYGVVWVYPHGVRTNSLVNVGVTVWYNGEWKRFGDEVKYGGYISGLNLNGNALTINDYHGGNVVTNGVYGLDGVVIIDNTQSTAARFLGGNAQANYICAGSGGDTLWGSANNDVLIGGVGSDNFWYGAGEGNDFITNADWLDTVTLYNMGLRNIGAVYAEAGTIVVAQDADNSVTIQFNETLSPLIKLADGSQYRYNGATGGWQNF